MKAIMKGISLKTESKERVRKPGLMEEYTLGSGINIKFTVKAFIFGRTARDMKVITKAVKNMVQVLFIGLTEESITDPGMKVN